MLKSIRLAVALALLSGPVFAQSKTLTVAAYGGVWDSHLREKVFPDFEKKYGVKVDYVAGNSTDTLAKLQAQKGNQVIDVAIMERTRSAAMVPCTIGWADIGSWNELWRLGSRLEAGNRLHGDVVALDTSNSLVWSDDAGASFLVSEDLALARPHTGLAAGGGALFAPADHHLVAYW